MKRACPYDVNFLRMSKVHLMDHHVENAALSKIHGDTLKKLRDGARNTVAVPPSAVVEIINNTQTAFSNQKQMLLSHYFSRSKISFQLNNGATNKRIKEAEIASREDYVSCSYCEKVEQTCKCRNCQDDFCPSCCFPVYNSTGDYFMCLSCS